VTGRDLRALVDAGARLTVWVSAGDGAEVCDLTARAVAAVAIDGHMVLVARTDSGHEVRLPVDVTPDPPRASTLHPAPVVRTAGGLL
jgi:hypothetical protein